MAKEISTSEAVGSGPGWAARVVWFVVAGWWMALIAIILGTLLCITIIGIPPGIYLLRRVLKIATLKRSISRNPEHRIVSRRSWPSRAPRQH